MNVRCGWENHRKPLVAVPCSPYFPMSKSLEERLIITSSSNHKSVNTDPKDSLRLVALKRRNLQSKHIQPTHPSRSVAQQHFPIQSSPPAARSVEHHDRPWHRSPQPWWHPKPAVPCSNARHPHREATPYIPLPKVQWNYGAGVGRHQQYCIKKNPNCTVWTRPN